MSEKVTSTVVKMDRFWVELRKMKDQKRRDALAITFFNSLDMAIRRNKKKKPGKRQQEVSSLIWAGFPGTMWEDFRLVNDLFVDFEEVVGQAGGKIKVIPGAEWGRDEEEKQDRLYLTIRFTVNLKGLKRYLLKAAHDKARDRWSPKKR